MYSLLVNQKSILKELERNAMQGDDNSVSVRAQTEDKYIIMTQNFGRKFFWTF